MIPAIIERLVIQGDAQIIQQTIGLSGAMTIEVPTGKTVVILGVNLQPLLSLADIGGKEASNTTFADYQTFVRKALAQDFNPLGEPFNGGGGDRLEIIELLLKRGITQVELYSVDNRTVFTYTNEYTPVPLGIGNDETPPADGTTIVYLPTIKEHKEECYSVHKKQVHVRLRFTSAYFYDGFMNCLNDQYVNLVTNEDLSNTVPEQEIAMDINKPNIYMNLVAFTQTDQGKTGIFPFANETQLNGTSNLGSYDSDKFFMLPYTSQGGTGLPNGYNGELGYFVNNVPYSGAITLLPYQQLFTPYINIQYALINEQPSSLQIVSPDKYQTVIPSK